MEQLREIEDKAILEALEMQRKTGIEVVTDGEYRRSWWAAGYADAVERIVTDPDAVYQPRWSGEHGELADATSKEIGFGEQVVGAKLRQVRRSRLLPARPIRVGCGGERRQALPDPLAKRPWSPQRQFAQRW